MNILTLVYSIGIGGTERAAVNYAIGYKQFGHDSRVLVLGEGHERLNDLLAAGVEVVLVTKSDKTLGQICDELHQWGPSIIHTHNFNSGLVPHLLRLKNFDTRIVETNVFSRPCFEPEYNMIALSMQLSAWGYWKYTRWMKREAYSPQVAIVPYIVINNKFTAPSREAVREFLLSHQIPEAAFVVGRIGQAHPSKWDNRIIDVVEKTVSPDNKIYYLFVAAPANLKKYLQGKSELVQSRVKFIDKIVGDENLSLCYHSMDCFGHIAKIGESFGYVLAEALLCGVPVITMLTPLKDNAQMEVIGHEYGGICATDTNSFTKAVLRLYHSPEERERLVKNLDNGNWVESRFSPSVVIPAQIGYYEKLLAGKTIPPADVSGIIKDNFKLYGATASFHELLSKIVNHRYTLSAMSFLSKLKNIRK